MKMPVALLGSIVTVPLAAIADCPNDEVIRQLANDIEAGEPVDLAALGVDTADDGRCAQTKLVAALSQAWGAPVGYKAGLTSAPAQAKFGVDAPLSGRLFENGLLEDGAIVPATWGALPRFEADLLVEVADAGINSAETEAEVLGHLAAIYPFIELPDLVAADPKTLTGPLIKAINVGARLGIVGEPIAIDHASSDQATLLEALARMQVRARDQDGVELMTASGSAILGQPLRAVLWLLEDGARFEPGDLISLGSLGPLLPPEPGTTVTVTYNGLPGDPSVGVRFD
jgi:2-oxo-hept-3-ene-1,7-dioate hydratase